MYSRGMRHSQVVLVFSIQGRRGPILYVHLRVYLRTSRLYPRKVDLHSQHSSPI